MTQTGPEPTLADLLRNEATATDDRSAAMLMREAARRIDMAAWSLHLVRDEPPEFARTLAATAIRTLEGNDEREGREEEVWHDYEVPSEAGTVTRPGGAWREEWSTAR